MPVHSLDKAAEFSDNGRKMVAAKKTRALRELAGVLAATKDPEAILAFLQSLLTASETNEIASRWELVKCLDLGQSQRQIARQLGLSLCKITRGSRELKKKNSPFKDMIEKLEKKGPKA